MESSPAFHPSRLIHFCLRLLLGANYLEHGLFQLSAEGEGNKGSISITDLHPQPHSQNCCHFLPHSVIILDSSGTQGILITAAERFVHTTVVWGGLVRKRDICVVGPDTLAVARWVLHKQLDSLGVSLQRNSPMQKHNYPP